MFLGLLLVSVGIGKQTDYGNTLHFVYYLFFVELLYYLHLREKGEGDGEGDRK